MSEFAVTILAGALVSGGLVFLAYMLARTRRNSDRMVADLIAARAVLPPTAEQPARLARFMRGGL